MKTNRIYTILFATVCCLALGCNDLNTVNPIDEPDKQDFHIIPQEDAIANLYSFMDEVQMNTKSGESRVIKTVDSYPAQTKGTDNVEAYIINFENNSGYAVLGARSDMTEIIAVTEKGNIDPVTLSIIDPPSTGDSLDVWFPIGDAIPLDPIDGNGTETEIDNLTYNDLYNSQEDDYYIGGDVEEFISQTITNGIKYRELNSMPSYGLVSPEAPEEGPENGNTYPILPMLETNWGQSAPYNNFCKLIGDERRLVGCSCLAAGMIFAYNQYPTTLRVNGVTIDWDTISSVQSLTSSSPEPQISHIPLMLASIFWKCDRMAASGWTLVTPNQIKKRFMNMGYSNVQMLQANDYTDAMHTSTLAMLNSGKPVFISALGRESGSLWLFNGHSWVIDGAASDRSMLHCNWGWRGTSNGYFSKDCFHPVVGNSSYEYTYHFRVITYNFSGTTEKSVTF